MRHAALEAIFSSTSGHCHFCGDSLIFERRGMKKRQPEEGAWEVDHVIQKGKGGKNAEDNYLPACVRCNRLRWHRKGSEIRELLLLGLIAKDEIKKGSETGRKISEMITRREEMNRKRRTVRE